MEYFIVYKIQFRSTANVLNLTQIYGCYTQFCFRIRMCACNFQQVLIYIYIYLKIYFFYKQNYYAQHNFIYTCCVVRICYMFQFLVKFLKSKGHALKYNPIANRDPVSTLRACALIVIWFLVFHQYLLFIGSTKFVIITLIVVLFVIHKFCYRHDPS